MTFFSDDNEKFMRYALNLARIAFQNDEVPIGAVVVKDGQIIAEGYNQIEMLKDATAHAEMIAITSAANYLENWRLQGCTLYVTVEPCMMCSGAIVLSRLDKIVFGAYDDRMGFMKTNYNPIEKLNIYKNVEVVGGVLEDEATQLMQSFFQKLRDRDRKKKV